MAEETQEHKVWVFSHKTGQRFKLPFRRVDTERKRRHTGLEIIDDSEIPTQATPEETAAKVEELKKEFSVESEKVEPETVEPEQVEDEGVGLDEPVEAEPEETENDDLESKELSELKELADERGIDYAKNARKSKMIELLTEDK